MLIKKPGAFKVIFKIYVRVIIFYWLHFRPRLLRFRKRWGISWREYFKPGEPWRDQLRDGWRGR